MADIIDTRDLIREREELLAECECDACGGLGEHGNGDTCATCGGSGHANSASDMPEDDPDRARVEAIEEASTEISEWESGETLIPESEFTEYAQQLAEDIGAISSDAQWPLSYIDWERAADALRMDYSVIEIDGTDYLYRS